MVGVVLLKIHRKLALLEPPCKLVLSLFNHRYSLDSKQQWIPMHSIQYRGYIEKINAKRLDRIELA